MSAPQSSQKPVKTPLMVRSHVPLVIIAGVCLLASAGVLGVDGHLGVVWPAFLLVIMGPLVFPFILFPAGLMAGLWSAFHGKKKKAIVSIFAVGSVAYLALVMAATLALTASLATAVTSPSMRLFAETFVVVGAVTPWAVFALRDRYNQLFLMLVWSLLLVSLLLLPLKIAGLLGPLAYAGAAWCGMLLVMLVEHLRQSRVYAAQERAKAAAEQAAQPAVATPADEPAEAE